MYFFNMCYDVTKFKLKIALVHGEKMVKYVKRVKLPK
jgi:hypothetical protein